MTIKHIIFVPGKNPKPQAEPHRNLLWKTIIEGVRRVDTDIARSIATYNDQFHLISWNYLFYHQYRDITPDILWVDALLNNHGPSEQDIQQAHSWPYRLNRLLYNIADHAHFIIPLLPAVVKNTTTELNHYFDNTDDVGYNIRNLLKQKLKPLIERNEPVLIIGHSLGSVIAYDALWEMTHYEHIEGKVDFLTLGSPLGMHYVQRRLMGIKNQDKKSYSTLINRWINISSEGDIVALERNFHNVFKPMIQQGFVTSIEDHSHGIYNFFHNEAGLNCHRSYGYLVNPATGSIIADWWKSH